MAAKLFFLSAMILIAISCTKPTASLKAADQDNLNALLKKIKDQTDTAACDAPKDWSFVALGVKACGGPKSYLAFPHSIDTTAFLDLVRKYNQADAAFNEKYQIVSDCMHVLPPNSITCDNGNPVLIYRSSN